MRRNLVLIIGFVVFMSIFVFQGCAPAPGNVTPINVTANITVDTTWATGNVYVIENNISVNARLTIQPGVVVKFKPGAKMSLSGTGYYTAIGYAAKHIVFTAYTDDSHGGNTDGVNTTPIHGYWTSVDTGNQSASMFVYCDFYYAETGLDLTLSSAIVSYCTFAHNSIYGLKADYAFINTIISGNTFYDNEKPVVIDGNCNFDGTNIFHDPNNTAVTNYYNGIFIYGGTYTNLTWEVTEVPYIIETATIAPYTTLTLKSGVILKFKPDGWLKTLDGARLFGDNGAEFTAYTDDTLGGDTDHASVDPIDGYWDGVCDNSTPPVYLHGINFHYATNSSNP